MTPQCKANTNSIAINFESGKVINFPETYLPAIQVHFSAKLSLTNTVVQVTCTSPHSCFLCSASE